MLHPSTLALSKLAVLMLFNKIFKARPYRLAIGTTAAVVLVWLLASLVAAGLECGPRPKSMGSKHFSGLTALSLIL